MIELPGIVTDRDDFGKKTATLMATVGLAAVAWVFTIHQMSGMNMGVETRLGSFGFFISVWVSMMAAMMLPGAIPAVWRSTHASSHARTAPMFVASYLAVWTLVGIIVFTLYQPHGTLAAGVITMAAGVYELTPLKRYFRRLCQESVRSGSGFGLYCVGSSIGLMLMLIVLGIMSIPWMSVIAVLILAQKYLPAKAIIDMPVALVIIGLGLLIIISPSFVPGLMPPM